MQTKITFVVFQGEVGINWQLAGQSKGKPLSVGKVVLVHCRDSLDHLLFTGHNIFNLQRECLLISCWLYCMLDKKLCLMHALLIVLVTSGVPLKYSQMGLER